MCRNPPSVTPDAVFEESASHHVQPLRPSLEDERLIGDSKDLGEVGMLSEVGIVDLSCLMSKKWIVVP